MFVSFPAWCLGHSIVSVPAHFSSIVFLFSLLEVFGYAEYIYISVRRITIGLGPGLQSIIIVRYFLKLRTENLA